MKKQILTAAVGLAASLVFMTAPASAIEAGPCDPIMNPACMPFNPINPCMIMPTTCPQPPVDDHDSVATPVENAAPNGGDNNYDEIADAAENQVASAPNPNDTQSPNSYVTLEVIPNEGDESTSWTISYFMPVKPEDFDAPTPTDRTFPIGMFDLRLVNSSWLYRMCLSHNKYDDECCGDVSKTATVRLLLDRVVDHTNWTVEQYNDILGLYSDYSANAKVEDLNIGFLRTVITWTLTDGGTGDQDGTANGSIQDPANATIDDPMGPSVKTAAVVTTTTTPVVTTAVATTPVTTAATLVSTGNSTVLSTVLAISLILGAAATAVVRPKNS